MKKGPVLSQPNGYSLVELTIVVGLVSVLAITISAIVLTTIVNSTRIKTEVRLRQTGDYAIGQINTLLRNSRHVISCDSSGNTITIENPDAKYSTISLAGTQIATNSGDYLTPPDTQVTGFSLNCLPSDSDPEIVNVTFSLGKTGGESLKAIENPIENFSTSAELRNN